MQTGAGRNGRRIAFAIVMALVGASAAQAQEAAVRRSEFQVASLPPAVPAADREHAAPDDMPAVALSPDDSALLDRILAADAFGIDATRPPPRLRFRKLLSPKPLDVTRTDRPDGGSTIIVKQPLPTEWDAKVGADLGLAANPTYGFTPDNPLHVVRDDAGSGAAWASLAVPRLATIDARLDPTNDRGRLGTTFTRSLPLGEQFAVTLQSQATVTETYGQPQAATPDIPLAVAPTTAATGPGPACLGQRQHRQVRHSADRHHPRRRPVLDQHRSGHAQHAERGTKTLWRAQRHHGGHRYRPDRRKQKHQRASQADLVIPF